MSETAASTETSGTTTPSEIKSRRQSFGREVREEEFADSGIVGRLRAKYAPEKSPALTTMAIGRPPESAPAGAPQTALQLPPVPIDVMCLTLRPQTAKAVASFVEGAAVFALARMWYDLIAAYIFGLQAEPFCDTSYNSSPCTEPAGASAQLIFSLFALPITGLIKHVSEDLGIVKYGGMWDDIPQICNYFIGWAFGNTFAEAFKEWKVAAPALCEWGSVTEGGGDCVVFDVLATVLLTILLSFCVVILSPLATDIECGDNKCVNWLEDFAEDTFAMIVRACSVVIMVQWYSTLYGVEFLYVPGGSGWQLRLEMQVFYTLAVTYIGTIISTKLESAEEALEQGLPAGQPRTVFYNSLKGLSDMTQTTLSYVVGCAWSDIITTLFSSLGAVPSLDILGRNVLLTACLTGFVAWYIGSTGQEYSLADAHSREATEAFLLINGAAFFVGWTVLVVLRDLHAQYDALLVSTVSPVLSPMLGEDRAMHYTTVASVLTFCFALSVALFMISARAFAAIERNIKAKKSQRKLVRVSIGKKDLTKGLGADADLKSRTDVTPSKKSPVQKDKSVELV